MEKTERWRRVARAAAEQSGQLFLPEILEPLELTAALSEAAKNALSLFFWEEAAASTQPFLRSFPTLLAQWASGAAAGDESRSGAAKDTPEGSVPEGTAATGEGTTATGEPSVTVFIGPEGGFASEEAVLIREAGAHVARLGHTILRTETAAIVACALVLLSLEAWRAQGSN
jgi:16S rRNA (uracil1498-N3)-methyltransferase